MDYILYHANCQDGWVAAYIAAKKWPSATLLPLSYGLTLEKLDNLIRTIFQKDVIMVDYSFPTREEMKALKIVTKSLRVFDHHISKKDILEGFDFTVFDNKRSGAGLAWDYLFGKDSTENQYGDCTGFGIHRPWWVNYTEDQDLWNWKLPYSREINSYLMIQERSIYRWEQIETITEPMSVFDQGLGAQARAQFDVRDLMRNVQVGLFHGYETGVINTPIAVSEVGETIYNSGFDIAMAWHERAQGDI